ncbi:MAG: DUF11 domain-containing protein, partial [Verrucomicrobiota bacterium]
RSGVGGSGGQGGHGGTGADGGGLLNLGQLTIDRSTLSNNRAGPGGRGGNGGSTANHQTNWKGDGGWAGAGGHGGAIDNHGSYLMTQSTLSGNRAGDGGDGGDVARSIGSQPGGGWGGGGGQGGSGGGLANVGTGTNRHVTLADNQAGHGGNGGLASELPAGVTGGTGGTGGRGGGIWNMVTGNLSVAHALIADNARGTGGAGGGCVNVGAPGADGLGPDGFGGLRSEGYNLIGDGSDCGFLSSPGTGDSIGAAPPGHIDPLLGPLQVNGGFTATRELLPGSPALNIGDPLFAVPPADDQRGAPRIRDGRIDIGAFELETELDLVLTKTASVGTVVVSNAVIYTLSVQNLGPAVAYDVVLTDPLPPGAHFQFSDGPCALTGGVVTCSLGIMAPGEGRTVRLVVTALGVGLRTNTAMVTTSSADTNLANNIDSVVNLFAGPDDYDGDGMANDWESTHRLNPYRPDAHLDPDGDGVSNQEEYTADTRPDNPNDFLHIESITYDNPVRISYSSSPMRVYSLQARTNLRSGGWRDVRGQVGVAGSGGTDTFIHPSLGPRVYYRLKVNLPP